MSAISHPACNGERPFQQEQGERGERAEGEEEETQKLTMRDVFLMLFRHVLRADVTSLLLSPSPASS